MKLLPVSVIVLMALFMPGLTGTSTAAAATSSRVINMSDVKGRPGNWVCIYNVDDTAEFKYIGSTKPSLTVGYGERGKCIKLDQRRSSAVRIYNYFLGYTWGLRVYLGGTMVWQDVEGVAGMIGARNNKWVGSLLVHRQTFNSYGLPRTTWTLETE